MDATDIPVTLPRAEAQVLLVLLTRAVLRLVHPQSYPCEPPFPFRLCLDGGLSSAEADRMRERMEASGNGLHPEWGEVSLLAYFCGQIDGGRFDHATLAALTGPEVFTPRSPAPSLELEP